LACESACHDHHCYGDGASPDAALPSIVEMTAEATKWGGDAGSLLSPGDTIPFEPTVATSTAIFISPTENEALYCRR
jgi:hypothetical protein